MGQKWRRGKRDRCRQRGQRAREGMEAARVTRVAARVAALRVAGARIVAAVKGKKGDDGEGQKVGSSVDPRGAGDWGMRRRRG